MAVPIWRTIFLFGVKRKSKLLKSESILCFIVLYFCVPGVCGDNVDTQPLADIRSEEVPLPPSGPAPSPEITSDERRSSYQRTIGKGEKTLELPGNDPASPGKWIDVKKKANEKNGGFTESENEAWVTLGHLES